MRCCGGQVGVKGPTFEAWGDSFDEVPKWPEVIIISKLQKFEHDQRGKMALVDRYGQGASRILISEFSNHF